MKIKFFEGLENSLGGCNQTTIVVISLGPGLVLYSFNLAEDNSTVLGLRNNFGYVPKSLSAAKSPKMTTPFFFGSATSKIAKP